jgi:predicted dehydrogenase
VRDGKLQIGLVGVGGIGHDQHLPGWGKVPFAEVKAIADLSQNALDRVPDPGTPLQRFTDWRKLVEQPDLDIVDICTPNRTHTAIAVAALAAGKHVLCEKPLATTPAEVRSMIDTANRANRLLMAAQHYRFDPASQQMKALIDAGMLGHISYIRAQWLRRRLLPPRPTFIEQRLSGGGAVLDIGVHVLDLAYWFLGAPEPVSVTAFTAAKLALREDLSSLWGDWDRQRFDVEDFGAGFVRFASGSVLTLEVSWLAFQPERELIRLQCFGERGGLVWPDGIVVGETNRTPWDLKAHEAPRGFGHQEEIRQFAAAVRDGSPSPVPAAQTLNVTRILEAFYLSAECGREVMLT